jgi:hypothetical protein
MYARARAAGGITSNALPRSPATVVEAVRKALRGTAVDLRANGNSVGPDPPFAYGHQLALAVAAGVIERHVGFHTLLRSAASAVIGPNTDPVGPAACVAPSSWTGNAE